MEIWGRGEVIDAQKYVQVLKGANFRAESPKNPVLWCSEKETNEFKEQPQCMPYAPTPTCVTKSKLALLCTFVRAVLQERKEDCYMK